MKYERVEFRERQEDSAAKDLRPEGQSEDRGRSLEWEAETVPTGLWVSQELYSVAVYHCGGLPVNSNPESFIFLSHHP